MQPAGILAFHGFVVLSKLLISYVLLLPVNKAVGYACAGQSFY